MNYAAGNSRGNARAAKPLFLLRLITAHPLARVTGMSIFVEARVN
jgi:hypothetical protein